jgi:hypothetical protein
MTAGCTIEELGVTQMEAVRATGPQLLDDDWYFPRYHLLLRNLCMGAAEIMCTRRLAFQDGARRKKEARAAKARALRDHPAAKRHRRLMSIG